MREVDQAQDIVNLKKIIKKVHQSQEDMKKDQVLKDMIKR
jgi:hypothetical protein